MNGRNRISIACAVAVALAGAVAAALVFFPSAVIAGPGEAVRDTPAAGAGAAAETRPSREPSTWHEYRDHSVAYNRATLAHAYKQHGKHGKWDDAAVKFLDRIALYFANASLGVAYRSKDAPKDHDELVAAGKAVVDDAGCDDPLVRYCYGVVLHDGRKDLPAALRHVAAAVDGLEKAGYPPNRVAAAAARLARLDPDPATRERMRATAMVQWLKMSTVKLDDARRRLVYGQIWSDLDEAPRQEQTTFLDELRKRADADPWVRDTLTGCIEVKLAWDSRGSGWANTVTEDGWKGFFEHLTKARDALTAAYNMAPANPEAPTEMITVAMGGSERLRENTTTWFQRAESAQLDYAEAYSRMYNALLPRWGGDYGQIYALGVHATKSGRYDTDGPWQLFRAVTTIVNDGGGDWQQALAKPGVYGALSDMADRYAADATAKHDPKLAAWYHALRGALAWRAQKFAEACKFLDKVPGEIDGSAFQRVGSKDPPAAIGYVYAMAGPHAEAVRTTEEALRAEKFEDAERALRPVAAAADLPPRVKPYLDARLGLIDRRLKFTRGDWLEIQPDRALARWQPMHAQWSADDQGRLFNEPTTGEQTAVILYSEPVGDRFEYSMVAEPYEHDGVDGGNPGLTLCAGGWPTYYVSIASGEVGLMPMGQQPERIKSDALKGLHGPTEVVVRLDRNLLSLSVNGNVIVDKHPVPPQLIADARVGVIAMPGRCSRYSKLKIRRLVDAPANNVSK